MAFGRAEVGGVLVEILPTTDRARVQTGGVLAEILPTTDRARVQVGGVLAEILPTDDHARVGAGGFLVEVTLSAGIQRLQGGEIREPDLQGQSVRGRDRFQS